MKNRRLGTSIAVKVIFPHVLLLVAGAAILLLITISFNSQREAAESIRNAAVERLDSLATLVTVTERVEADLTRLSLIEISELARGDRSVLIDRLEQSLIALHVIFGQIEYEWTLTEEEEAVVARLSREIAVFRNTARQSVRAARSSSALGLMLAFSTTEPYENARADLAELKRLERRRIDALLADTETMSRRTVGIALIIGAFLGSISLAAALLIAHQFVIRPIVKMTETMGRLAAGELDAPQLPGTRRDEIGAMERALEVFRANEVEKSKVQALLRDREQQLRNVVEHSTNVFYAHTVDQVITYVSPQIESLLGYDLHEAMVRWTQMATDNPVNHEGLRATVRAIDTGEPQDPYPLELRHKDGHVVWVEVREAPVVEDGRTTGIVGALTDVTERRSAELTQRRYQEELRLLARHVQQAREEQNAFLARELHDELGQLLSAVEMNLSVAHRTLSDDTEVASVDRAVDQLKASRELIQRMVQTTRSLVSELRPGVLDTLGASGAIEWLVSEVAERSDVQIDLDLDWDLNDLEPECSLTCYRFVQEALTNAVRHAQAHRVAVKSSADGSFVAITVSDDGVGFDPERSAAGEGFGLIAMRERADAYGGSVEVTSASGHGTRLVLRIPAKGDQRTPA